MNHYSVANDVTLEDKKRSILLSVCGLQTYKVIRNLVDDTKMNSTSYDEIVNVVKSYYDSMTSAIIQRYKFNTRMRAEGESVATYVAALRELAQHCEYKDMLPEMLVTGSSVVSCITIYWQKKY